MNIKKPLKPWIWITWQPPDILAMLNSEYILSKNFTCRPFSEFSLGGGSATVGVINIPSSLKVEYTKKQKKKS